MTMLETGPDPVAAPPAGEVLVTRRPLTWHGKLYGKGEVLDPQPEGRRREVMARAGFIVAEVNGLPDVVARVQAVVPEGLVCPTCAAVLKTPVGLKVHRTRVHGGT